MQWLKPKKIALILVILFFISGIWVVPLMYYIDSKHPIHLPPTECDELRDGEVFCHKKYWDDGLVRFSVARSEEPHCCIFERFNIQDNRINYRVKACDPATNQMLHCENFRYNTGFASFPDIQFGDEYDVRKRFTIDDRLLLSMPKWEGHIPQWDFEDDD